MLKLYLKSLVFVFCLFLLLCAVPLLEQPQKELEGIVFQSFSLAEAGPLPVLHFQAPVFNEKEEALASPLANPKPMLFEDQLDDIAEKLDIIQRQVDELMAQANANKEKDNEKIEEDESEEDKIQEQKQDLLIKELDKKAPVADGHVEVVYPKILISEAKISPIEQRFIKLYNPNASDVNLTGWYLQRKTATGSEYSSFVTKNDFAGKTILANSYFIISRGLPNSDILIDDLTITENNSFTLKNPNREISDEMVLISPSVSSDISPGADTTPPTGTITINNGAEFTNSRNVVLVIFAADDMSEVVEMKIANASSYHDWEPYATTKDWVLPATNGVKTVRIKFKDSAENETAVGIPDIIILDTTNIDSGDYFPDSGDYF